MHSQIKRIAKVHLEGAGGATPLLSTPTYAQSYILLHTTLSSPCRRISWYFASLGSVSCNFICCQVVLSARHNAARSLWVYTLRLGLGSPSWWNQSWFYNPF